MTSSTKSVGVTRKKTSIPALALTSILLITAAGRAQTVVESSQGTSGIVIYGGGLATVNFVDASAKIGYMVTHTLSKWPRLGAEIKGKATNGFASLSNGSNSPLEGELRVFAVYFFGPAQSTVTEQWVGLEASGNRSVFSIATTDASNPVARHDTLFRALAATGYYNALLNIPRAAGDVLWGVSAGYGKRNNYDQLKKAQVCQTVASSLPGTPVQVIQKCKDARIGDYREVFRAVGDMDILWVPKVLAERLAFDALARYDGASATRSVIPGIGVFITEKGAPEKIVGGFLIEWERGSRPKLGIQAGLPF
jgi:hypothetical protein